MKFYRQKNYELGARFADGSYRINLWFPYMAIIRDLKDILKILKMYPKHRTELLNCVYLNEALNSERKRASEFAASASENWDKAMEWKKKYLKATGKYLNERN